MVESSCTPIKIKKCVIKLSHAFKFVSDFYIKQEMYDKSVNKCSLAIIYFPVNTKLKKCMTEMFLKILFQNFIAPIDIELKECVMKLLMIVPQH